MLCFNPQRGSSPAVIVALALLVSCSDERIPTGSDLNVLSEVVSVRNVFPGPVLSDFYMVWDGQSQFHLSNETACSPEHEFRDNGLRSKVNVVSGGTCTQYAFGTFRILPRSGNTDVESITAEASVAHTGAGTGCSSINSIRPWIYLIEKCGVKESGTYTLDLLTNTPYRMETNAQALAGASYESILRLNLSGPAPAAMTVLIDIKPGSEENAINPEAQGSIPVAVLTTRTADGELSTFDALAIDWSTVRFGRGETTEAHARGHQEDVDGDGDLDLLFHFGTRETEVACSDTNINLTGATAAGASIVGSDVINTKCGRDRRGR